MWDMKKKSVGVGFLVWATLLLASCSREPKDAVAVDELPGIYPDYVDVTIPVGIAPLNFSMADDSVTVVDVVVKGSKGGTLHANGDYTDFDTNEWQQLLADNRQGELTVTVCAKKDGRWTRYRDFTIHISPYELGEWGITYRRIAPSYEMYGHMGLYQRDLSNFNETPLINNDWSVGTCLNCHTANATNPDQYVFHARGDHAGTFVHNASPTPADSHGASPYTPLTSQLSMVYPYWHPGGRYVAFSTNKTSQMFHLSGPKRIEVYDSSSDVFIFDTEANTILADTLIMKKYWAENTPAFSPDGRWLYFTTARRQVYPTDYDKERYSLCRVSFDEQTGRIGQTVDTLISADRTGKSITWPRPSYDGRYIMYTQVDYGYFSVWHPEADLWMLDLQTAETRPIDEVNTTRAESLHNWSANSHWFLFTSRRDDGLYSRIYFASINEQGQVTKPFMLPQRNPKHYYRHLLDSYNTPDFTLKPVKAGQEAIRPLLESDDRTNVSLPEVIRKDK